MESFCKGINSSESLKIFDLSFNNLTIKDVSQLVMGISPKAKLTHLKLINYWMLRIDFDVSCMLIKFKQIALKRRKYMYQLTDTISFKNFFHYLD